MVWWTCNSWFCRHAIVGHLASTTVCTSHLINERLRQKSQQYAIFFYFDPKTSVLKDFYNLFSNSVCFLFRCISQKYQPIPIQTSKLFSLFDNKDSICMSTSSQISPLSKLPLVTSMQLSLSFFFQCSLSLYHKDFVQCFVIRMCFSGILIYFWVNRIASDIVI